MSKIHLIMPMGGGGTRFENKGFNLPKPLIVLQGRPFFYWAVQSVKKFVDVKDIIFIVLQEHIDRFGIDEKIKEYYPDAVVQVIPKVLNGAVLTCCEGLKVVEDDGPVLFNDCDHAFWCEKFNEFANIGCKEGIAGALLTFTSEDPKYSFVKFDEMGRVCGTVEKKAVSNEAICGAYYFRNKTIFLEAVNTYLSNCNYSEYFVSGVYNEMAKQNMRIEVFKTEVHLSFGTPEEFDEAVHEKRLFELIGDMTVFQ